MFKREMKINFKSFVIWTAILIGLFLVVFLVYPSIIDSENVEMIDTMMKIFPEEPKLIPSVFFVLCVNVDKNKHTENITIDENIGVILNNMYDFLSKSPLKVNPIKLNIPTIITIKII